METAAAETSAAAEGVEERVAAAERGMKVLVPVDESEGSIHALRWAVEHLFDNYADALEPAEQEQAAVTLVNVQPIFQPFIYPAGPVVYATPAVIDTVKKAQEQNAATILARALAICKEKKIKAETLIMMGDPKDMICQAAEELHVDLLVIGSRGLGPIKRALLGSVSNYCVHDTTIVSTVESSEDRREAEPELRHEPELVTYETTEKVDEASMEEGRVGRSTRRVRPPKRYEDFVPHH